MERREDYSCPFCSFTITGDLQLLQSHVEVTHCDVLKTPPKPRGGRGRASDVSCDDGSTSSPLLSDYLAAHLREKHPDQRFYLSPHATHFGRAAGDSGWGCGYRNLQMMIASLMQLPEYQRAMNQFEVGIPSILRLQELIEQAWSRGFDPRGREQLRGRLVGTRKWIGATEVFAFLSSLKLHCRIIDFHRFNNFRLWFSSYRSICCSSDSTEQRYSDADRLTHPALFEWMREYFASGSTGQQDVQCNKPVVYLQHEGHSRSVVGVKLAQSRASHLLVFDPSVTRSQIDLTQVQVSKFLKPPNSLKKSQYQVVCVCGVATERRCELQKNVDRMCEKIPLQ